MGFGYLFLGYLTAFLLELTVNAVGAGPIALLVGYALMGIGIVKLYAYQRRFRFSLIPLGLLFLENIYRIIGMICAWASWNPAWMTEKLGRAMSWAEFALILAFHVLLLPAIGKLAASVDLPKTVLATGRDLILVFFWAGLYLAVMFIPFSEELGKAFGVVLTVVNLLMILMILFLLLSCMKNIAPADEDDTPHRYRWNLLNRIGDRVAREHDKATETYRREAEERLRKSNERRQSGKTKHKKHK